MAEIEEQNKTGGKKWEEIEKKPRNGAVRL